MSDSTFLPRAIQTLARLDHEGWLEDYRIDVAEATRGPADDLQRYPQYVHQVARFARIASQLFCASASEAQQAAIDALLPTTRRSIALELLDEYEQRLDEAALKAQAARRLATDRRRSHSA
ncbi:MAG: hypothetical protein C0485_18225 [Pirellula sp.]|nr:hypothetical protein [Pirellula sp.]